MAAYGTKWLEQPTYSDPVVERCFAVIGTLRGFPRQKELFRELTR